jgi:hypothetical protein
MRVRSAQLFGVSSSAPGGMAANSSTPIAGGAACVVFDGLGQNAGEDLQHFIADRMAEGDIDLLELLMSPPSRAERGAQNLRLADGPGEIGIKATPAVEPSERGHAGIGLGFWRGSSAAFRSVPWRGLGAGS